MNNFVKKYIKLNRSKKKLTPIGTAIHETATPGADAMDEFNYFNGNVVKASAHAFIDWKMDLNVIPWDEISWHAKDPANQKFISMEMCRPENNDPKRLEKMKIVYRRTVEANARIHRFILSSRKITKENCMSHDEIRLKWRATTHTDPTAFLKELGKTMDDFRKESQEYLDSLWK